MATCAAVGASGGNMTVEDGVTLAPGDTAVVEGASRDSALKNPGRLVEMILELKDEKCVKKFFSASKNYILYSA